MALDRGEVGISDNTPSDREDSPMTFRVTIFISHTFLAHTISPCTPPSLPFTQTNTHFFLLLTQVAEEAVADTITRPLARQVTHTSHYPTSLSNHDVDSLLKIDYV